MRGFFWAFIALLRNALWPPGQPRPYRRNWIIAFFGGAATVFASLGENVTSLVQAISIAVIVNSFITRFALINLSDVFRSRRRKVRTLIASYFRPVSFIFTHRGERLNLTI